MKASLRRIESLNVAKTLLGSAEDRFAEKTTRAGSNSTPRSAFACPERPPRQAPEIKAGDRARVWEFAEPVHLISMSHREYGSRSVSAIHEAGHFVVAEHFLSKGARLTASVDANGNGTCSWDQMYRSDGLDRKTASAAIAHAGAMAELSISGQTWAAPILHGHSFDWDTANRALEGSSSMSGAHAVAQMAALVVIEIYWARLREVAKALHDVGRYSAIVREGAR